MFFFAQRLLSDRAQNNLATDYWVEENNPCRLNFENDCPNHHIEPDRGLCVQETACHIVKLLLQLLAWEPHCHSYDQKSITIRKAPPLERPYDPTAASTRVMAPS
ncbi:hypothetical protein P7K49_018445 [Saguinus oedipus]|uniref:Uncharacterized protein n=1 Tax=Saguinus oedipus TaxID=9490 RepID=A0ABQ9V6L1_SAGOE|nr:hypothetical protein P7K49_018445 [Saguinus oedipus]